MKKNLTFLLIIFFIHSFSNAQEMEFLKDSIMAQYMENGYANEHFMPSGKTDKKGLRQGKWKDYEVEYTFTIVDNNNHPNSIDGYFLRYGEGNFVDNLREGKWKLYVIEDKSFKKHLQEEVTYSKGVKTGSSKFFYPNSSLAIEVNYVNDMFEGEANWYYENGTKNAIIHYKEDMVNGTSTLFYPNGKIKSVNNLINDTLNGLATMYYDNGIIQEIITFEKGIYNGTYKYFYSNGQLWIEKEYAKGSLMNVKGSFDQNGNSRDFGTIKNGNGTVKYYTEEGIVYSIQTFENGNKIKDEPQSVPNPFIEK